MNILVVSDNVLLVSEFIRVTKIDCFAPFNFFYKYSSINKTPASLISLGMTAINVKTSVKEILANYDLVISAHCKQIFPKDLVSGIRCINIHPGLNPHNRGWFPQVFSIINGKPAGATVHIMDEEIDHGDIIVQSIVDLCEYDTSQTAYDKVQQAEIALIEKHLLSWINEDYIGTKPAEEGNYNGIQDFKALCELDLNQKGTLQEHLNLLRALTHGDYANAHYINDEGEKVFVKIELAKEVK
ncbi:dTDP-4-amino-4,6-dideoxyglucose formyltransferase [Thalassotalea euphylliae]|uniref:dTDP-4-amino-4,6-dideoxyglucose formyltransferase n=1 Tax=Thalassotalea euphylliae TaxID=1655234 RepID=A0A3E0U2H6_9GAMM|nr:dTDP-4-amino-4,6-dideoxyglucose formyltransferase [Thalassotalea euphylliae]REL30222.1 dTDP-4-amino-4,6-dideoxyglucose formyltransferase [Thalassotalea euphylliae]